MTSERIKEIQATTAYPESVSVHQALLQVWNECAQAKQSILSEVGVTLKDKNIPTFNEWTETNGYTQLNEQYFANVKGLSHTYILYRRYKKEIKDSL